MARPQHSETTTVQYCPSPRELDDLELLCHGALAPLRGFESADGSVTLQVPPEIGEAAVAAGELSLVDPEGAPLATVTVEATYSAAELTGITGPVTATGSRVFGAFRRLYLSPQEVTAQYGPETLSVPVTAPLTTQDLAAITESAAGKPVLLLALVGTDMPDGLSATGLLRASLAAADLLPAAQVVAVPLARHVDSASQQALRDRVVACYAPGQVLEVAGSGTHPTEIAQVVERERPPRTRQGLVVFFTGSTLR